MNEDLAWGLSVLLWIVVVAVGVLGIVNYGSIKQRLEQVTGGRPVENLPATSKTPVATDSQPSLDTPIPPSTPSTSYREMLTKKDDRDG